MRDDTTASNCRAPNCRAPNCRGPNCRAPNHTGPPRRLRRDVGQSAIVVVAVAAALLVVIVVALADVGRGAVDRARAQSAADAAALASLDGGPAEAARFAERHGATLVSWSAGPGVDEVTVVVRLGDATATARATDAP